MEFNGESFTHSTLDDGYDFIITNKWNKKVHFKIDTFPVPSGLESQAIEVVKNDSFEPYIFSILSGFDSGIEHSELLLKAKIKRGINRRYLEVEDGRLQISDEMELGGRISYNDSMNDTKFDKVFVIDGKRITVESFMQMLSPYEGFNFKLEIIDSADEIE